MSSELRKSRSPWKSQRLTRTELELRSDTAERQEISKELSDDELEKVSWAVVDKELIGKVTGYPDSFTDIELGAIRAFHKLRWNLRRADANSRQIRVQISNFQDQFPDEILDQASPAFGKITAYLTKGSKVR